jgi:hypothetical protein
MARVGGLLLRDDSEMNPLFEPVARPTSLDERRKTRRRVAGEAIVYVTDGADGGVRYEVICRDTPGGQTNFLIRSELSVGQIVQIEPIEPGPRRVAEVIRCRALSTGRFEVTAEYKKSQEAPRPSESQRRHERRLARLQAARSNGVTLVTEQRQIKL